MCRGKPSMVMKFRLNIDLKEWQPPDLDLVVHAIEPTAKMPLINEEIQAVKVHYLFTR
jgi:hypothetical protein